MLAFENAEEFTNLWWLDAYCFGRYPQAALAYLRETGEAPEILPGDLELCAKAPPTTSGSTTTTP
jgi:6-phospho-beta-glucosidase